MVKGGTISSECSGQLAHGRVGPTPLLQCPSKARSAITGSLRGRVTPHGPQISAFMVSITPDDIMCHRYYHRSQLQKEQGLRYVLGSSLRYDVTMELVAVRPLDTNMVSGSVHILDICSAPHGHRSHGHQYRPWLRLHHGPR